MALLITAADVLAVYDTDRDETKLTPFLQATEAFTDAHLAGKGLAASVLREVQRYYAAHLLFVTEAGVHETLRDGDISERFTKSERNPGLLDSRWGRMAVTFDTSGTLAALAHPQQQAELRLIGSCSD